MFDKNEFKNLFRSWAEHFHQASLEEASLFCDEHIPPNYAQEYEWLKEQSLLWFSWYKKMVEPIQIYEGDVN